MVEEIYTGPNAVHPEVKALSKQVMYALQTNQLSVSHITAGIINEKIIELEHEIEDKSFSWTPEEKALAEGKLDVLVSIFMIITDLEYLREKEEING